MEATGEILTQIKKYLLYSIGKEALNSPEKGARQTITMLLALLMLVLYRTRALEHIPHVLCAYGP